MGRSEATGRIDRIVVDEAETLPERGESPYLGGMDWGNDEGSRTLAIVDVSQPGNVLDLAARLVCTLQRDRAELVWRDDADRYLEALTQELGRLGVFAGSEGVEDGEAHCRELADRPGLGVFGSAEAIEALRVRRAEARAAFEAGMRAPARGRIGERP